MSESYCLSERLVRNQENATRNLIIKMQWSFIGKKEQKLSIR